MFVVLTAIGFIGALFVMLISSYIGMKAGVTVMNRCDGECHRYAYNIVLVEAITFILLSCVLGSLIVTLARHTIT